MRPATRTFDLPVAHPDHLFDRLRSRTLQLMNPDPPRGAESSALASLDYCECEAVLLPGTLR